MAIVCSKFIASLIDYCSGEIDPDVRADCAAHLVQCSSCIEYLRSYEATIELSKDAFSSADDTVREDTLDELVETILSRVRTRRPHH